MSVVIDYETVERQLSEIEEERREREHDSDLRRRRAIQGLSALGLLGAGAREAYRREFLDALPDARLVFDRDTRHLETSLAPDREVLDGAVAETSAHAAAMILSAVGGRRRADEAPWLSLASAGFMAFRAVAAGRRVLRGLDEGHLDVFSAIDAVTSAAAVPLAVPEAMRAVGGLLDGGGDGEDTT